MRPRSLYSPQAPRRRVPVNNYEYAVFPDNPSYLFVEGEASGDVIDVIGGKIGVLNGAPTFGVTGPVFGKTGIVYPASTAFHSVTTHPDLENADAAATFEFWYRRDVDTGGQVSLYQIGTNGYSIVVTAADKVAIGKVGVAVLVTESGTTPADGVWHHFAIPRTGAGAGNTLIYKDGVEGHTDVSAATALANSGLALEIGREGATAANGALAYVAYYKSALSASRVLAHYQASFREDTSTASWDQAAATWAATSAETFADASTWVQAAATWSATAAETFTSTATWAQAAATWSATATEGFASTATFVQAASTWVATAAEAFASTASWTQAAATWAATMAETFASTASFVQAPATWSAVAAETFADASTWTQQAATWAALASTVVDSTSTASWDQAPASWAASADTPVIAGAPPGMVPGIGPRPIRIRERRVISAAFVQQPAGWRATTDVNDDELVLLTA